MDAEGERDVLLERLQDDERQVHFHRKLEQDQSERDKERDRMEDEMKRVAKENAEKERAAEHLGKLNARYADLKAPALRKELKQRGISMSTSEQFKFAEAHGLSGKKAVLLERLAQELEKDLKAGKMKDHYEETPSASMLMNRVVEELAYQDYLQEQQKLAEIEARGPDSIQGKATKGAAKGAAQLTKGLGKGLSRAAFSAARGTAAAAQAAAKSLNDSTRIALAQEVYNSDDDDDDDDEDAKKKGIGGRLVGGITGLTKGVAKGAMVRRMPLSLTWHNRPFVAD